MRIMDLSGEWQCAVPGASSPVHLPGTLDENAVGGPDDVRAQWKLDELRSLGFWHEGDPILTRLTRLRTFEGKAVFSRALRFAPPQGMRLFLTVERARKLAVRVNGREAPCVRGSLASPWVFELTGLASGEDLLEIESDNSYPGWPRDDIVYSSAASDETQTNWNGLLGELSLCARESVFIEQPRVLPSGGSAEVRFLLDAARPWSGEVRVSSPALAEDGLARFSVAEGRTECRVAGLRLREDAARWDAGEGEMHPLTLSAEGLEPVTVSFGIRDFRAVDSRLTLNGRPFFLRGEANCCVFPETGHAPMDVQAWREALGVYRSYGVNCMRFHSHCPHEAAFAAADEMGMLMQPELGHWNPASAFSAPEAQAHYRRELLEILAALANHPSFVMLTFGNELQADETGLAFMHSLLGEARAFDPTRLYAGASNPFYGARGTDPASDFYTSSDWKRLPLRLTSAGPSGPLNTQYPDFRRNFADTLAALREESDQPVFSFEVGQYEVLPDFDEIADYRGVTRAENLAHVERKVREAGLSAEWKRRVAASGELSLRCYRAEVEAALRTPGLSGISLLGLQDFPGQGTALVGMLNAHLRPKPYDFARPERFAAFFRDTLPMALLPRMTWLAGETLEAEVVLAHYGRGTLTGSLIWELTDGKWWAGGELGRTEAEQGGLTRLGCIRARLPEWAKARRLTLSLGFAGNENRYDVWVCPDGEAVCPPCVHVCRTLDGDALARLRAGGRVFLEPDSTETALPGSVKAQFSTDFWSVCTFPYQSGCMGQLIEKDHPALKGFPTEEHTDWQWWPMAVQRAVLLPRGAKSIVTVMDSCALLRSLTQLFECRCEGGSLLVSTMGLHALKRCPEARALQASLLAYAASADFSPSGTCSLDSIQALLGD